jgi:hypothetical protein
MGEQNGNMGRGVVGKMEGKSLPGEYKRRWEFFYILLTVYYVSQ